MLTSEFEFDLPHDLIAQSPVEPRDQARLMVINRDQKSWQHCSFGELPDLLRAGDVLARNNTRVMPARLRGYRAITGGKWEGLFLRECSGGTWEMLATTRGRPAFGEHIIVGQDLHLVLEARGEGGSWIVRPQQNNMVLESTGAASRTIWSNSLTSLHPPWIRKNR